MLFNHERTKCAAFEVKLCLVESSTKTMLFWSFRDPVPRFAGIWNCIVQWLAVWLKSFIRLDGCYKARLMNAEVVRMQVDNIVCCNAAFQLAAFVNVLQVFFFTLNWALDSCTVRRDRAQSSWVGIFPFYVLYWKKIR